MNLGELVSELEQDYESLKQECRQIEEQLDELEGQLEQMVDERDKFKEFREWVELVYPEIVKDFNSVKIIEEVANGL